MAPFIDRIVPTVERPDLLLRGLRGEYKAIRAHLELPLPARHLVAVYREVGADKVLITSYLTSDPTRIKGEVVWRRRR